MTKRTRKHQTTAGELNVGDVIAPDGHGDRFKATVTRIDHPKHWPAGSVAVDLAYPDDFTVNARHRGETTGRAWMADQSVTRYREA